MSNLFKRSLLLVLVICCFQSAPAAVPTLTFSCSAENDLFVTLQKAGRRCARFNNASHAIQNAPRNSVVLILANQYPAETTKISSADLELAKSRNLRLFVEFPDPTAFPELKLASPQKTVWERAVVATEQFGEALPKLRILAVHNCHFLPAKADNPLLVVARVAGFDTAVYGLPQNASPLLFELPERNLFIATSKLSNFVTGRYAPARDWETIWEFLLAKLDPPHGPFDLKWTPTVAPAFGPTEKLPRHFERNAFNAAAGWFAKSRLLVPPSRRAGIESALATGQEITMTPPKNISSDGSLGILEGYDSGILSDGHQRQRLPLRADCNAESAMVLALHFALNHDRRSRAVAQNLLDFIYFKSGMCVGVRANPKHAAFGLIGWGDISPAWLVANYGDDNARTMLATMLTAACLKSEKWNEALAKALLANFRTTGKLGYRGDRIDLPALQQNGWKTYATGAPVNHSPHFESGLWACHLWAYRATGFQPFFDKATNAIAMTMAVYPGGWRWQDNMERARMLLCLAWLVRLDDTHEHRGWLMTVANDLLERQQPTGAIHEWLGGTGGGHYQIPQSNEAYGTGETPLIQKNGDPASDQLYTAGFALLGLHEAAAATIDPGWREAEDKFAEFLCRIQIRSKAIPYLDGWWFRAFDDRRWEFWASSADAGWGAWSIEAGWGQAWTAAVLGLRQQNTTVWDLTTEVRISKDFERWKAPMLEN